MDDLSNEEHEALLLMCGHAIGPPLSPATHAVLDAYTDAPVSGRIALVAALRAAAFKLREAYANEEYVDSPDDWLDSIAAELEQLND